jgi:hypothetical protein
MVEINQKSEKILKTDFSSDTSGRYLKTFYGRNLQIFEIS